MYSIYLPRLGYIDIKDISWDLFLAILTDCLLCFCTFKEYRQNVPTGFHFVATILCACFSTVPPLLPFSTWQFIAGASL